MECLEEAGRVGGGGGSDQLASIACISIVVEVNVLTYKDKNAKINNCRGH